MDSAVGGGEGNPVEGASVGAASGTPGGASGRGKGGPKKRATAKRKSSAAPAPKPKKRRKKVSRPAGLGYTVQEGEDMLLVIGNTGQHLNLDWRRKRKKTAAKKKKKGQVKGNAKQPTRSKSRTPRGSEGGSTGHSNGVIAAGPPRVWNSSDHRWGQSLPEEVLVSIFQMIVVQDGAVPFLCRVSRVCRLWNAAASSPSLWRCVSLGFCWVGPGQKLLPRVEGNIKDTVRWLSSERFTQLRDFTLHHWKKNVDYAVQVVSESCPQLASLTLSYCTGVTGAAFQSLAEHSSSLQSINLQYSDYQVESFAKLLETNGKTLRKVLFTHGPKNDRLLAALSSGCCADLELLEINTKLDSGFCQLPIRIQALQHGCPKLKTFRMLNVIPVHKTRQKGQDSAQGFPLLEELCMATSSISFMSDSDLWDLLSGSPRLRVLDLRGCSQVTALGLGVLPCQELECLFWGQYFNFSVALPPARKDLHRLLEKWGRSLRQLDLANQLFSEDDLELALGHLARAPDRDTLRSLNLSGTRVTLPALRLIIRQSTALNYLNLLSCRNLPRGLKRVYRGQEDIRQLLGALQ